MKNELIFGAEDEGGLSPVEDEAAKSGHFVPFTAGSDSRRQAMVGDLTTSLIQSGNERHIICIKPKIPDGDHGAVGPPIQNA